MTGISAQAAGMQFPKIWALVALSAGFPSPSLSDPQRLSPANAPRGRHEVRLEWASWKVSCSARGAGCPLGLLPLGNCSARVSSPCSAVLAPPQGWCSRFQCSASQSLCSRDRLRPQPEFSYLHNGVLSIDSCWLVFLWGDWSQEWSMLPA